MDNATETTSGSVTLPNFTGMALFSPDSRRVYAPVRNVPVSACARRCRGGYGVAIRHHCDLSVPSARYIALSPSGQYLLAFADDSDSVFLIDLTATTVSAVEIPGFARPVNAFFKRRQQYRLCDQLRG